MHRGGARRFRLAALLLGASALQACANNPLALIDGPFIPASERAATVQQQAATAPVVPPVPAPVVAVAEPAPEPEPEPEPAPASPIIERVELPLAAQVPPEDLAYPDQAFVGPVLTAPEMAQLAAPPAMAVADEAPPVELAALAPVAADDLPDTVGPDFLPPEEPEPQLPPPARVAAAPTDTLVGPAAGPAQPRVELATRLPSAFDFAPPAPAPSGLAAFHQFAVGRLSAQPPRGGRESMLLADPPSLDPALVRCANRPPAVLLDLDPANALAPLVEGGTTPDSAELGSYLADLRQRGVTVYWITGHGPEAASAIRRRLVASGLDSTGRDPLIVTRFAGESKQARRQALGETHCLLAIVGDQRGDFDELYDFLLDTAAAAPLEQHVGNGWFLTPPPLD